MKTVGSVSELEGVTRGYFCEVFVAASTAIYTHVSGDFMNTALRKALTPAFDPPG